MTNAILARKPYKNHRYCRLKLHENRRVSCVVQRPRAGHPAKEGWAPGPLGAVTHAPAAPHVRTPPVPFHHGRGLCVAVASVSCYLFFEFFRLPPSSPTPRQSPPSLSVSTRPAAPCGCAPNSRPTGGGGERTSASAPLMRLRRAMQTSPPTVSGNRYRSPPRFTILCAARVLDLPPL